MSEVEEGNKVIRAALEKPAQLITRLGRGEALVCLHMAGVDHVYTLHLGVTPPTPLFRKLYIEATQKTDLLLRWDTSWFPQEKKLLGLCRGTVSKKHQARAVEALWYGFTHYDSWFRALDNKRVLFVFPFVESAKLQLDKLDLVYGQHKENMPKFASVEFVNTPQTQQANPKHRPAVTWKMHLHNLRSEITAKRDSFDIALLACGGYGFPLALHIKEALGKTAFYVGGALPTMFGIIGERYLKREKFATLMNDHWVRPLDTERPTCFRKIEGGCYW